MSLSEHSQRDPESLEGLRVGGSESTAGMRQMQHGPLAVAYDADIRIRRAHEWPRGRSVRETPGGGLTRMGQVFTMIRMRRVHWHDEGPTRTVGSTRIGGPIEERWVAGEGEGA